MFLCMTFKMICESASSTFFCLVFLDMFKKKKDCYIVSGIRGTCKALDEIEMNQIQRMVFLISVFPYDHCLVPQRLVKA